MRAAKLLPIPLLAAVALTAVGMPAQAQIRVRSNASLHFSEAPVNSLDATLGYSQRSGLVADARVMTTQNMGAWTLEAHALFKHERGEDVAYAKALGELSPPKPPATWLDLSQQWTTNSRFATTALLDRLSFSYSQPRYVLKLGRQAITWGGGLVFHPSDIVAPFSPTAVDTSYKPGADMLYGQWLFDDGSDVQAIILPRAERANASIQSHLSTTALRARTSVQGVDASAMLARDRGDTVTALGLSGPLGGASWNAEAVHWSMAGGEQATSWLLSVMHFGSLGAFNYSGFAELFHNGLGVKEASSLAALPAALSKRLATGQVFTTHRDYLALGANIQLTADTSLAPNVLVNLNDGSRLTSLVLSYSVNDDTQLNASLNWSQGADGTAFGGLETKAGSAVYAKSPSQFSLSLVHFY